MSEPARERWTGRTGFLMAAIGSAVGLGNMWRFSYLTAENGGAAFVLLYLVLTLVIGLPVLLVLPTSIRSYLPAVSALTAPTSGPRSSTTRRSNGR